MSSRKEIGYAENEYADDYTWQCARVFEEDGRFILCCDGGCSCNGPMDDPFGGTVTAGPAATLGGLFDQLNVDKEKYTYYEKMAFLDAIERMNLETIRSIKSALGLK